VQDLDITDGHTFPHKVEVDLGMLHALVLDGVGGQVDSADVVTIDEGAPEVGAASRPPPCHCPRPDTQPRHSSKG
jgi:hypothetical protein